MPPRTANRRRPSLLVLVTLLACAATATLPASAVPGSAHAAAAKHGHRHGHRVGGAVSRAWPQHGRAPRTRQARWLARQVGAIKPLACAKSWRRARARCHLAGGRPTAAAALSAAGGDPGSPPGERARIAASSAATVPLKLVRSYEIPADDPSYERLLNWSWIYDSAVAAAAFAATGDKDNAAQLLDQLAALQYTDGSLEIAFNTVTGESARVFRSGTVAWAGLAAATYDTAFGSNRYLTTEELAADYLLSLRTTSGLIVGGPDVTWVSTQHNLIAYVFLARLATELRAAGDTKSATRYQFAATTISTAIDANLLVSDTSGARFRQGLKDDTPAVDVQALGAMYLQGTGRPELAAQVLDYAQSTFAVSNRSIELSKVPDTFNMSYAAGGPFSGYAPYAGAGAPDVMWAEASGEMRLAQATLGQDTSALDKSIAQWAAITNGAGPLQADTTLSGDTRNDDFHVWPASTAAAWTVLSQKAPAFFAAPLPAATTLVANWTKVRGGNLITTSADGGVSMVVTGGERRVLDVSAPGSDYSVASNATLVSGAGYGIYVRASVDTGTKLTGYCVQLDKAYGAGEVVVREIESDVEYSKPIARVGVPTGFTWYGVPHVVAVVMKGNTMTVTVDGAQLLSVPDLAAASSAAVKYQYASPPVVVPPASGGYGLRAWGTGFVTLQQMTVGPAD